MSNIKSFLKNLIKSKSAFYALLFLLTVSASFTVRTLVYNREVKKIAALYKQTQPDSGSFLPFTEESAMMYSYTKDVALGKGIPQCDKKLIGMGDTATNEQFTVGLEYFLGYGYRLKNLIFPSPKLKDSDLKYEDNPYFSHWISWQLRLWASLIAGIIFLWLINMRCKWWLALFGGLLHAVSPAAIARYTGQDIVRGEFCLPLLIGTIMLAYSFYNRPKSWKLVALGIVSFLAIATWDMCQIFLGIWSVYEITRLLIAGGINTKHRNIWLTFFISAVFAALLIPYHRTHLLIISPLLLITLPVILATHIFGQGSYKRRIITFAISFCSCLLLWKIANSGGEFSGNYGHFMNLMIAKIEFGNVKPSLPSSLNFDARIIWVPAMHSATKFIMIQFFPMALYAIPLLLAFNFMFKSQRNNLRNRLSLIGFPLFMTVLYFIGFIFIVRYHVFLIIFACILIPLLINEWIRTTGKLSRKEIIITFLVSVVYFITASVILAGQIPSLSPYMAKLLCLFLVIIILTIPTLYIIHRMIYGHKRFPALTALAIISVFFILGSELSWNKNLTRNYAGYYPEQTNELIRWFRKSGATEKRIMSDFAISSLMKAYTNASIVLQPKFELGKTRENYENFIITMYHGTERDLHKYCEEFDVEYFIYDRGYNTPFDAKQPGNEYSARYMANALKSNPFSPVYLMFNNSNDIEKLRHFYRISPPEEFRALNSKYTVFKVISEKDKKKAEKYLKDAEKKHKEMRSARSPGEKAYLRDRSHIFLKAAVYADPCSMKARWIYKQIFGKDADINLDGNIKK